MYDITIIIPHYNDLKNLCRLLGTIPSTRVQTIVVDNSPELLISDFDNLISKYENVEIYKSSMIGAGLARNIGLTKAKADWILFADSDDIFLDSFLDRIKPWLKCNSEVIYFPPKFEAENKSEKDYRNIYSRLITEYIENPTDVNEWRIRLTFDVPWSKLIKRSFIEKNKFTFDNAKKQNDTIFSQNLGIFSKKISVSSDYIYCALDNRNSITHKMTKSYFDDAVDVRIRSYLLKMKNIDNFFLRRCNEDIFISPIVTILSAFKTYRQISYTYETYKKFKKKKIPVFSKNVLLIFFTRYIKKVK